MGDYEGFLVGKLESIVRYHSKKIEPLHFQPLAGEKTVSGGQFDWGGRLLKGNGGVQRFPQIR